MVLLVASAIVGIVGWAVAPVINRLIGKAQSYAAKKYKWHTSVLEKLESVAHFLDEIGSTVGLVEERRIASDPNMVCWLSQLKGAIDKVEDMFDLLDYEILKSNLPDTSHSARHASGSAESAAGTGLPSAAGSSFTELLEKLLNKLDDIRQSSRGLVQASLLAATSSSSGGYYSGDRSGARTWRPVTGPLLPQEPLGYDDQYENLVTRLLLDQDQRLEGSSYDDARVAVAIVGHGGMGKTTLARRACNDPRVHAEFDLLIWAWVYGKFSEGDILGEIWRSAAQARDAETSFGSLVHKVARLELSTVWNALTSAASAGHAGEMSFSSMQQALEKLVSSKRYLLVLDDMCNDDTGGTTELRRREMWSNVLSPFRHGKRGSRVLVTTRAEICAATLDAGANRRVVLNGIGPEAFIRLLKRSASSSRRKYYSADVPDELDDVLKSSALLSPAAASSSSLAWKCKRSPLAAKAIGLKLRKTNDRNKWVEILNSSTECHEDVMAAHVSSYQDLPPRLQCCFAFLSLFPNNFRFQPEMLVKMWVAHGFINDDGSGSTMEDTAREYFNGLLSRSLLQAEEVEGSKATCYVIHEEVHAMIRWVSANYFLMVQEGANSFSAKKIPLTVRHLSVTTGCLAHLSKHSVLKRLRTLVILRDPSSPSVSAIDEDIIKDLSGVRLLDLTGTDITDLPKGISDMVHLRYLALPVTLRTFPEAITKLLHLQTLFGFRCSQDQEAIPQKEAEVDHMNLDVDEDVAFKLCAKHAAKHASLKHLGGMNSLRGSLSITGLDAVASKEDAQTAQLQNKKFVRVLKFEWDAVKDQGSAVPDLGVLEGLQPHIDVQVLHIRRYRGTSSPNWLASNNLLQLRLTHLYIVNCRKWAVLPAFGHLPCLNHLQIQEMNSVKQIDGSGLFQSLETLVLSDMKSLVEWATENSESRFPILKRIYVSYCPELVKLPTMPTTLKVNKIQQCPKLERAIHNNNA